MDSAIEKLNGAPNALKRAIFNEHKNFNFNINIKFISNKKLGIGDDRGRNGGRVAVVTAVMTAVRNKKCKNQGPSTSLLMTVYKSVNLFDLILLIKYKSRGGSPWTREFVVQRNFLTAVFDRTPRKAISLSHLFNDRNILIFELILY